MRILVCAAEAPLPPMTGLRHPLWELARRLADRHEVTCLGFKWPDQDDADRSAVNLRVIDAPRTSQLLRAARFAAGFRSGQPMRALELRPLLQAALADLDLDAFDVALIVGLPLGGVRPDLGDLPATMMVFDAWHLNIQAQVADTRPLLRPVRRLEMRQTQRFQATALRDFERVVAVSEQDAAELSRLDPATRMQWIPNGVDADFFSPGDGRKDDELIVFLGTLRWAPNIQAAEFMARDVMPLIRARRPRARFAVVGRSPSAETAARLSAYDGVDVVGEVDDVRPWLRNAGVVACPMVSGTGIKNKLLEALACGAPSVATTLSRQGTWIEPGRDALFGDTAQELAAQTLRVLEDPELRNRLAQAGRTYVLEHHTWDVVAREYEAVLDDVRRPSAAG